MPISFTALGVALVCSLFLAGCGSPVQTPPPSRPIRPAIKSDAKLTEGCNAYLNAMFDKIQFRWEKELEAKRYPGAGKSVTVTFIMDSSGEIRRIKAVDGDAGKAGEEACVTAITSDAPYGKWPADLRAAFGDEEEIKISFYYQ